MDMEQHLRGVIARQKARQLEEGVPDATMRRDRMRRLLNALDAHQDQICDALFEDFGGRSKILSLMTEVMLPMSNFADAMANLESWMAPQECAPHLPPGTQGRAWVQYQPLGVVGIMAPWNTPVNLTLSPLFGVLAAGNRAVLKPSELTPACSHIIEALIKSAFDEEEIAVVMGDASVGATFSRMPFDHLLFTGGTEIGKHIMRAAAENLVPVTLELGGKSPVVVSRSANLDVVAEKVLTGKMMNAGQICLSPDYAMLPREDVPAFLEKAEAVVRSQYPTLLDNPDYTSVINARHHERLQRYVDDARAKGATIIEINPANEDFTGRNSHKMPPRLITDITDDMLIAQEEIFGPILLVRSYDHINDAIQYINSKPRPLALYYFGTDEAEQDHVLANTTSGGVTVNDVIRHAHQHSLPFGGVGDSGMGHYHGFDGFKQFSNQRGVFAVPEMPQAPGGMRPPFSEANREFLKSQIANIVKAGNSASQ